jgi:hypothetical protein
LHVNHTGGRLSAALRAGPPAKSETGGKPEEPQSQTGGAVSSSDAVVGGSTD